MKDNSRIIDKIRKTLEMAERAKGNEEEAATAARMVEGLLRKHNLTMADITPAEAKSSVKRESNTKYKWTTGRAPDWANWLAVTVAKFTECEVVWVTSHNGNDSWVKKTQMNLNFIGLEVDVVTALHLFDYLYKTTVRLSNEWGKTAYIPKGKARTYKNSFRRGVVTRLMERMDDITKKRKAEAAETGTALMVVKADAIAEYLGYRPAYRAKSRTSTTNSTAYASGHAAGGGVNFNKQLS